MLRASRFALQVAVFFLIPIASQAVEVISGPGLQMSPNGRTPLAGVVRFETDVPVGAELTISGGADSWTVTFPDPRQQHALPVLGLKPDRFYSVEATLLTGDPVGTMFVTTDPLPADFPALEVPVSMPELMEPGFTMIDCFRRTNGDTRPQYTIIVDELGEVVWYSTECLSAVRQTLTGRLIARVNELLVNMDMLGGLEAITLQDPGLGLHHDLEPTPHGTYLSLSRRTVDIPEFPTSETDPDAPTQTASVRDEPVVEFLPDGSLLRQWNLTDILAPTRIAYDSLQATATGLDWVHTNAVTYNLEDDSIVVSARHQDAVFKFSRSTGELIWILGPHDNWPAEFQPYLLNPIGAPFRWQFHQHAPMWTGDGTLVLFDNGNRRASPFDGTTPLADEQNFSRGVEYEIRENQMDVRQLWEYGEEAVPTLYAFFICDADWQPVTGNRVMHFGGTSHVGGVPGADLGYGPVHTRIVEATGDVAPIKVFELIMYDPTGGRISSYRSERIPSLYPPQDVKAPNAVMDSVRADRVAGEAVLSWTESPVDSAHDSAQYYITYVSNSAASGFSMVDSTAFTSGAPNVPQDPLLFFRIVAANAAGTSGDEPAP